VGGYFKSRLFILFMNSLDLNDPPTAVGGILESAEAWVIERT